MNKNARIISIYAADTSGVCSALYELGGMVVVHDASGCNSTYSTHDEPRWYDHDSMIYISALTEKDAILGNDEKLINDIVSSAEELSPKFIAVCGSPVAAMIGTDLDSIAIEIENRTKIKSFAVKTDGTGTYIDGASRAFELILKNFCLKNIKKTNEPSVNILGATPLDFSLNGSIDSIKKWLKDGGFSVVSCLAMGSELENIKNAGSASCNLVISESGLAAALYLEKEFSIPFVCGVPIGKEFSKSLLASLKTAIENSESSYVCANRHAEKTKCAIVGESIFSGSLALALDKEFGIFAKVLCPFSTDKNLLAPGDINIFDEDSAKREFSKFDFVFADPLYKPIIENPTKFISLPHEAFSGRCFQKSIKNYINTKLEKFYD